MQIVQKCGMFLISLFVVTAPMAAASQTQTPKKEFTLSGGEAQKNGFSGRWLNLIYEEAFKRLGYDLKYVGVPLSRSGILSDAGETDGEIARVPSYGELHPNLIRVEEPSFSIRFSAYSTRKELALEGWQNLTGKDLNVDYVRGVNLITSKLEHYVEPDRINEVHSNVAGLARLLLKRSDVFISGERNTDELLATNEAFRQKGIYKVGIIEEVSFHAWLHNEHAALAPQLSKVLQEMKSEGLVAKFKIQAK